VSDAATILDRGYRRYEGERSGVAGAIRSVAWHSIRSVLGIGRSARHKIFPVISVLIAYLPALVFVGIAALLPVDMVAEGALPSYADYVGFIGLAIVLFCGMVAPEILVKDRRDGMLGLYLSTPLRRDTYLVAKVSAVMATLTMVTLGPPLLLLIAYTIEGSGPGGLGDWLILLVRIVASGVAISAVFAAVSLAAASLTDRRAFASVGIILLLLGSAAVVGALVDGADMSSNLRVFDLLTMPFELVKRIYGRPGDFPELSTVLVAGSTAAWTIGGSALVWLRYRRLAITR